MTDADMQIFSGRPKCNMIFFECRGHRVRRCIIVVASVILSMQGIMSQEVGENTQKSDVCQLQDCVITANAILNISNFNVSPCDDFYEYACGRFLSQKKATEMGTAVSYKNVLEEITRQSLKGILEEPMSDEDELLEQKAKTMYATCMNTALADQKGTAFLEQLVEGAGGWPMIKPVNDISLDNASWVDVHTYFHRLTGTGSLINILVYGDKFTKNIPLIHIDQPVTIYGKYSKIKDSKNVTYWKYIRDLALDFIVQNKHPVTIRRLEQDATDVTVFRQKLTKLMSWDMRRRNEVRKNNNFTFDSWTQLVDRNANDYNYSNINWLRFVDNTFGNNIPLHSSQKIIVSEPGYLITLLELLSKTSVRVILNHIYLHFVERHVKYTTTKMIAKVHLLNERITNIPRLPDRWRICLVENPMQHVLGRMYVRRYVRDDTPAIVQQLADDIRSALVDEISSAPWMGDNTKKAAVLKLTKMKVVAGYPEFYDDELQMRDYYENLPAGTDNLLNALGYAQNEFRLQVKTLLGRAFRDDNDLLPFEANAFYLVTQNTLQLNAAKLQWPYYTPDFPDVLLYARLGITIGHEMGHAFDIIGRQFDEHGIPNNWWEDSSADEYDDKIDCIANQFLQYEVKVGNNALTPNRFDVKRTASENVADAIGVRAAIDAFKEKIKRSYNPMPKLPRLENITDMQLFFIASATNWCQKYHPSLLNSYLRTSSHSLPQFRLRGPFSNAPEFSEAFNCELGTKMNPEEKCSIWED